LRAERANLVALVLRAVGDTALAMPPVHRLADILYSAYYHRD
jgi:hypothetical protein